MPAPIKSPRLATRVAALLLLALPGAAAAEPARRSPTPRAAAVDPAGTWTAAPADCTRSRRKLWQPDEGWVVRTVTTCR